jgi:hypothetical protein
MAWRRLGLVLAPRRIGDWSVSHAMVPFVRRRDDGLELWFSARDAAGRSHTGRAALSLDGDRAHVEPHERPLLGPGALGAFDDSGAMGASVVEGPEGLHLYYIGWQLGVTVPFRTNVGCALSTDGGETFERVSRGPVVGCTDADPFLATSPWVLRENGGWRMWYASGVRWEATDAGPKHYYRIVHAASEDGLRWEPTGDVCIDFADASEFAIARPSVVREDGLYRMWFSCRGSAYRIAYAESRDGLAWERVDAGAGLDADGDGWESRSVEYGCVFDHEGTRWMLYNGNGYGETGIGLARWEEA